MIELSEIEINLVRLKGGGRIMRLVHIPTGIAVEKALQSKDPVVASRNKLLADLEKRVEAGLASDTRRK